MRRLNPVVAAAALVGLTSAVGYAQSFGVTDIDRRSFPVFQTARLMFGTIEGTVTDERGGPLAGAMVSALGVRSVMAVTDARGRFVLNELPVGEYVVSAHLQGFVSSPRELIRVGATSPVVRSLQMRRAGAAEPLTARPILAAGLDVPGPDWVTPAAADPATADDHPHGETAWRLRHLKRSVLKDEAGNVITVADTFAPAAPNASILGRAFDGAVGLAASLFDLPFSGEVNLLTTSAFGPGQLFTGDFLPRGVAYVSIGAPLASGQWTVRAAMSQANLASWIVAGSYKSKRTATNHDYDLGVSYSTQQYQGGNPGALFGVGSGSRSVGEVFGDDRWRLSSNLSLDYGARYGRYDYLRQNGLLSPHAGITVKAFDNTHVTVAVSQRMLAPGNEEFVAPSSVGPWLPPERTFAPLAGQDLRVERGRFLDVDVEHDFDGAYVLGVRRYFQRVDEQLVTLFGLPIPGSPQTAGYYSVASAGDVDASGWGLRLASPPGQRVRGSVDYSITRAEWTSRGDMAAVAVWAPGAIRPRVEDLHDLTTTVETEIPETATRVFVLYRFDSAFTRAPTDPRPAFDARFDLQVNQALPFMPINGTKWEVLVAVRNLFRDPGHYGSVYDELLVVRPPKRVVGGVLVRF
jgi:carboxypeptidase family protein/TonB-dependent receptor-like protein